MEDVLRGNVPLTTDLEIIKKSFGNKAIGLFSIYERLRDKLRDTELEAENRLFLNTEVTSLLKALSLEG